MRDRLEAVERARDVEGDWLEVVVAAGADQRAGDAAERRKVSRRLLEDRPAPEQAARGVGASELVELGEALVDLESLLDVVGLARRRQEAVDDIAGALAVERGAVRDDRRERRVPAGERDPRRLGDLLPVAPALELERGLERQARRLGALRLLRARKPPGASIARRLRREPLVELAQADVGRSRPERLLEEARRRRAVGVRQEQRLANEIVRLLDRVVARLAPRAQPLDQAVAIAAGPRRALAEVGRERELGVELGGLAEQRVGLLGVVRDANRCLREEEGRAGPGLDGLGELGEHLRGLGVVDVRQARAHRRLERRFSAADLLEVVLRALRLARDLGDQGRREHALPLELPVLAPTGDERRDSFRRPRSPRRARG